VQSSFHAPFSARFQQSTLLVDQVVKVIVLQGLGLRPTSNSDDTFSDNQEMLKKLIESMVCIAAVEISGTELGNLHTDNGPQSEFRFVVKENFHKFHPKMRFSSSWWPFVLENSGFVTYLVSRPIL
jgi:hypothetical protein